MIYFFIIVGVLLLDQVTKAIINSKVKQGQRVCIIKNKLYITNIKNKGAFLGLLQKNKCMLVVFSIASMLVQLVALIKLSKFQNVTLYKLSFLFILSGGCGNIIDRIRKGEVTDFIDLNRKNMPIFNIADMFIAIGGVFLFIKTLFSSDS